MKKCSTCQKIKPVTEFQRSTRLGYQHNCKDCSTNFIFLRKYGITLTKYKRLWKKQAGLCAICGKPERRRYKGTLVRLAVDHDKATKEVRGLLCTKHNRALGGFDHDPELLLKAIYHLQYKQDTQLNFLAVTI